MTRTFTVQQAKREQVPLLVGLMGCSGSGKTYSALRLAKGIQSVSGGDIYVVDTESCRALHYADTFDFQHVNFKAPFGSLDYLDVLKFCVSRGAGCIVVDSFSHEHVGEGGYLDFHSREVERMAGNDYAKQERVKMAAWIKPAAARQRLVNGLLQLNCNFIFCFRAKEKTKPVKGGGVQELGWMPIAGEEMLFEMTLNCLLLPAGKGVPQWSSDFSGEKMMMKLPRQFEPLFEDGRALDERHGVGLAEWAKGSKATSGRPAKAEDPPAPPPAPKTGKTAAQWYEQARGEVMATKSQKELNEWENRNVGSLTKLERYNHDLHVGLSDLIAQQSDSFNVMAAG